MSTGTHVATLHDLLMAAADAVEAGEANAELAGAMRSRAAEIREAPLREAEADLARRYHLATEAGRAGIVREMRADDEGLDEGARRVRDSLASILGR